MANKQDLAMALNERQVVNTLSLRQLGRDHQWGIVLTCGKTGQGLDTGLEMLHMMIMKRKMRGKRNHHDIHLLVELFKRPPRVREIV